MNMSVKIVVVLDSEGVYQKALSDAEVDLVVLKRGTNDAEIDEAEVNLEEIE